MIYPTIFILLIWIIWIIDTVYGLNLTQYGIEPLKSKGLIGIITAPLLHVDLMHLISNSIPLFILGTGLFYFYKDCAFRVFFLSYVLTGLWTWFMARGTGIHVGASGIVNALITFHLTSAFIRKRRDLEAYSLIIILLYGGFIWGFFPEFYPTRHISWQSHLAGAIAGVVVAFYFKDKGPQRKEWDWGEDEDENGEEEGGSNESENKNGMENKQVEDTIDKQQQIDNYSNNKTVSTAEAVIITSQKSTTIADCKNNNSNNDNTIQENNNREDNNISWTLDGDVNIDISYKKGK